MTSSSKIQTKSANIINVDRLTSCKNELEAIFLYFHLIVLLDMIKIKRKIDKIIFQLWHIDEEKRCYKCNLASWKMIMENKIMSSYGN
jgi:hypothetical protein